MMNKVYFLFVVRVYLKKIYNLGRQNKLSVCLGTLIAKTGECLIQKPSQILKLLEF